MTDRRFVVDTNILISASLGLGAPSFGIDLIIGTGGQLVFSKQTWQEFESVLMRPKFDRYLTAAQREETLAAFQTLGLFVEPKKHFDHCRDPKDNQFLDVAVEGNVDTLITGDQDLLVLSEIEGIPIVQMADFIGPGKD